MELWQYIPGISDLPPSQRWKTVFLSLSFFLCVAAYWVVRSMKTALFIATVGIEYEPMAKLGTMVYLAIVMFIYNAAISCLKDKKDISKLVLFTYGAIFVAFAICVHLPVIGLDNEEASPDRIFGWLMYWTIESFGSVAIPMLWSVATSLVLPRHGKDVFAVITLCNQLGASSGSSIALAAPYIGFSGLFLVGVAIMMLVVVLLLNAFKAHGAIVDQDEREKPKKTDSSGAMEGLKIICTRPYVFSILISSFCANCILTIIDYQLKVRAKSVYSDPRAYSTFDARFGLTTNLLSLFLSLTGTKNAIAVLGLRTCLITVPSCALLAIALHYFVPSIWATFIGVVAMKALGYSLNTPARELVYMRTSEEVKYKAKSWIDMFGNRAFKAVASLINGSLRTDMSTILAKGSYISGGFGVVWLASAFYLGSQYIRLEKLGTIVS